MTHVEPSPQRVPPPPSGSFPNAWTLFRVQQVPVRVDRSWLLIAALVGYFFFGRLQGGLPGITMPTAAGLAIAASLLFFVSILAHELGHALTSLNRHIPVLAITLFALGGVTESTREARRARDEFVIVGIGPFISLVLAAAFGLMHVTVQSTPAAAALTGYLAWTNLALAIFNIVPAYPLDGGRLLRSVLWGVTGKPLQATRWAARVGQAFALAFIVWTLRDLTSGGPQGFSGLWNVLIGFFLFQGATASHRRARLQERFAKVDVRSVMGTVPPPLQGSWSLNQALQEVQQRPSMLWPVDDPVRGALHISQIDDVPSEAWPTTTVADVALPVETTTVSIDTPLNDAIERMAASPDGMLIVIEKGSAVGLLTPSLVANVGN